MRAVKEFYVPTDYSRVSVMLQGNILSAVIRPSSAVVTVFCTHNDRNPPKQMELQVVQTGQPWPEDDSTRAELKASVWDQDWDSPRWLHYATGYDSQTGVVFHVIGRFIKQASGGRK